MPWREGLARFGKRKIWRCEGNQASIDHPSRDIAVGVNAAVAEEGPMAADFFQPFQIAGHDQGFFGLVIRALEEAAERIADEGRAPEFQTAVGRSLVESDRVETARAALEAARRRGVRLVLPLDTVVAERADSAAGRAVGIREIPAEAMGLDIGPRTAESFAVVVRTAKTVVWNGPMGVFERPPFAAGTLAVARTVAEAPGFSVVGGGDTIAALATAGVTERIGYVSTAGGAFLEFLEGRRLPGVEALTEAPA